MAVEQQKATGLGCRSWLCVHVSHMPLTQDDPDEIRTSTWVRIHTACVTEGSGGAVGLGGLFLKPGLYNIERRHYVDRSKNDITVIVVPIIEVSSAPEHDETTC